MSDPWLPLSSRILKRSLDVLVSSLALILFSWVIALGFLLATADTRSCGLFTQTRIGRFGKPFRLLKLKTMRPRSRTDSPVTVENDLRVTPVGRVLRKYKIDELPQFWNVLVGQMSLVGPRPDVPGFADRLKGEDRIVLSVRPGITGPATLYYRNEASILSKEEDPDRFNREVLFPAKVRINRWYVQHYSFARDLYYLLLTAQGRRLSRLSGLDER